MTSSSTSHDTPDVPSRAGELLGLLDSGAPHERIARYLDALPPDERMKEVLGITGKDVGRLYEACARSEPLRPEDIVPPGETGTVIFEGRNSLPLFSRFQKRFARQGDIVLGYNHQTMSFFTGPGYFVVKPPSGSGPRGSELYFDYTVAPPAGPEGWPPYKPNDRGFSKAVYMNMMDYIRRVAKGVVVGKAFKLDVDQNTYFSLSRPL